MPMDNDNDNGEIDKECNGTHCLYKLLVMKNYRDSVLDTKNYDSGHSCSTRAILLLCQQRQRQMQWQWEGEG